MRRFAVVGLVLSLLVVMAAPAFALPGKPSSTGVIYADGHLYRSKAAAPLPAPNDHNLQSYDMLVAVEGQEFSVAEAAPGDRNYNGGRWYAVSAAWTEGADRVEITSFDQLMEQVALGNLTIDDSNPGFVECPLLRLND
jgi:hypothetical protein